MSQAQYRLMFEYRHLGSNMVSECPPSLDHPDEPMDVPGLTLDPDAYSYEAASDIDTDEEEEEDPHDVRELTWYPHATHFLAKVPHDDADWSRYLTSNADVLALCERVRVPLMFPGNQPHLNWAAFFAECARHLARAASDPPLASLFSLIFVGACHVALVDGCPKHIVHWGLKTCVRHCGVGEEELTDPMLDRLGESIITGFGILRDYAKVVGCRAHEIPMHVHNCLQLFQRCDSNCLLFIKKQIPSTYRPTTPLNSEYLELPTLVYKLLGAGRSKWKYKTIFQILCPEVTDEARADGSINMTDVLELNERDDGIAGVVGMVDHVDILICNAAFSSPMTLAT
ncbi:hypothetical protein F53441_8450 [Fusarium austroafricanum]|uniref:Uncharacterized protein n=1 Tax=Fusarium austroafricanum TaxID=2364996 RepID=A0A8H4KFJ1_9HYPO|nr:hypothetical protein F53441_8450 [Fusarium austroafricanum]